MNRIACAGLMLALGCSSGGTAGTSGGTSNNCTAANCNGCCGADGCEVGSAASACGVGGAACVDCGGGGNTCTPNEAQPCECIGTCWDSTLQACEPGNTDSDCGATFPTTVGTTCQVCRGSKHCTLVTVGDGQIYKCQ